MESIIQQLTDWLKGVLVSGIMDNLTNTFSSVNDQVGQIAVDVGRTPSSFLPAVFNMVRNLSESVIMPVAGILLTFIACYELIQLIISYNNLSSFETWFIWKWIFKTFVAVELITHTFDITMAVFDVSQSVVRQAGGLIQGSTAIDADAFQTMRQRWSNGIRKSIGNIPTVIYCTVPYVCAGSSHICDHQWTNGGDLFNGKPGTDSICNFWEQRTEHDGTELFERPLCSWFSGISHHGVRWNLCSLDSVCGIHYRYHRLPVESHGIYDPFGVHTV